MKYYLFVAITVAVTLFLSQSLAAQPPTAGHGGLVGGIESANTPTGPVVNGLALSLTTRQFKKLPFRDGYAWLALELRNEGSQTRQILWFSKLENIRVIVSDAAGHQVTPYRYPKVDFDVPNSTNGFPLAPGSSLWLAIPIDAMVPLQRPGTYVIRVKTAATIDAVTNQPIDLVSNPLTIRV